MRFALKQRIYLAAMAALMLGGTAGVRADMVTLGASADATLLGGKNALPPGGTSTTTENSLANPGIYVGTDGNTSPKRGLIEFDIAGNIPTGSTITGVALKLTIGIIAGSGGSGGNATEGFSIYDETQTWGQPTNIAGSTMLGGTGQGAAAKTGDATWNYAFFNSKTWTTAPGGNWQSGWTASDHEIQTGSPGTTVTFSSAGLVTDVQNWLDNPSDNFGWLLKNDDETDARTFLGFYSAQASFTGAVPPALVVTYTPAPEPASLGMLALGLPLLLRRRSKRS